MRSSQTAVSEQPISHRFRLPCHVILHLQYARNRNAIGAHLSNGSERDDRVECGGTADVDQGQQNCQERREQHGVNWH